MPNLSLFPQPTGFHQVWAQPSRAIDLAVKRLLGQRIQSIEKVGIVDHWRALRSKMHAVEQLIDSGQHLIDLSLLNQVGRRAILQQALTREQPQSRIVRLVEIGQFVDDELQLE